MEILRRKLIGLIRDDDGVALVVTLAFFMFMYVSCAGVFAIGRSVRERIILQNAVDAAAYSAAVVQADVLSRIATINRAMAWTYRNMVHRQMDYVTWKLLEESSKLYNEDSAEADFIGAYTTEDPPALKPYGIDIDGTVLSKSEMDGQIEAFKNQYGFTNYEDLGELIDEDRTEIRRMNITLDYLVNGNEEYDVIGIKDRMENTVKDALEANLPDWMARYCRYNLHIEDVSEWLRPMHGFDGSVESVFEGDYNNFNDDWFRKTDEGDEEYDDEEYLRSYKSGLVTKWYWKDKSGVPHNEHHDASEFGDGYYSGVPAVPYMVTESYFPSEDGGAMGAVSVAVARLNRNPWVDFIEPGKDGSCGLYDAFKPSDAIRWTVAVSSAQAGYRGFGRGESRPDPEDEGSDWRAYRFYYDLKTYWKTDDWDAAYIPVRAALNHQKFFDVFIERDGDWEKVLADSDVDECDLNDTSGSLGRMHNNGGSENRLQWESENFFRLMFH